MRYRTAGRFARTAAAFVIGTSVVSVAALAGADVAVAKTATVTHAKATAKAKAKAAAAAKAKAAAAAKARAAAAAKAKAAAAARTKAAAKPVVRMTEVLRTVKVASTPALLAALAGVQAGDRIELAGGSYTLSDTVEVEGAGTATTPIVITAAAGARPEIRGSGTLEFNGAYTSIDGLTFTNGDTIRVTATAHHVNFTRNTFRLAKSALNWLQIAGDDAVVDHNQFTGKSTAGVFLQIVGAGSSDMAERVWVHHNYFADHSFNGSNGGEAIRIGVSARQKAVAKAVIEDNLLERCNGDQEAISVKASGNIIRRNTIRDSKGTITLRHGNGNLVEGNLLIGGTTGIRVFGNDHTVINNVVQDSTRNRLIEVRGGDLRDDKSSDDDHDAADRVLVAFNTVITASKTSTALDVGDDDDDYHPETITLADNILVSGKRAAQAERGAKLTWVGNLGQGLIDGFAAGFQAADVKLAKDANGVYRPATGSAAIGTAIGSWSLVSTDVDGQIRPTAKRSVGADEPSAGTATNIKPATRASLGLS